eukprot:5299554-Heterocapsa_arctica.AAC.1
MSGEVASGSGNLIGNALPEEGEFDDEEFAAIDRAYVDHIMREYDEESWLFNIEKVDEKDEKGEIGVIDGSGDIYVSWDSGADDHVAPDWFGDNKLQPATSSLRDINGTGLNCVGSRKVDTVVGTTTNGEVKLSNKFNIGKKVTKPVCSMGMAYRQGFKTVADPNGECYFEKNGVKVPLILRKNSFYFK